MIPRKGLVDRITIALERSRCVALLGPRQCGKTTLARAYAADRQSTFLDLEDPADLARLEAPKLALERLTGLVVLDEVQLRPDLFPLLRVLLDREPLPARFLLLGSASPEFVRGASESLAGRIEFVPMGGLTLADVGTDRWRDLWLRGGLPPAYLAGDDRASMVWREQYLQTFIERDLRRLGLDLPAPAFRRFLGLVGHHHGQTWNVSAIADAMQLPRTTIRRYGDLLAGAFVVRQLPPWYANLGKRQVKSPKVYLRDSGIAHEILGIRDLADLESRPRLGASWEGFCIEEILRAAGDRHAYFWATHAGAEIDLVLIHGRRRLGIELKYSDAPRTTKSMRIGLADLELERLLVVHPGDAAYPLDDRIEVTPLAMAAAAASVWAGG